MRGFLGFLMIVMVLVVGGVCWAGDPGDGLQDPAGVLAPAWDGGSVRGGSEGDPLDGLDGDQVDMMGREGDPDDGLDGDPGDGWEGGESIRVELSANELGNICTPSRDLMDLLSIFVLAAKY